MSCGQGIVLRVDEEPENFELLLELIDRDLDAPR